MGLNPDNDNMYVINQDSNTVSVIDSDTNEVFYAILVGIIPNGKAHNSYNGNMYITETGSNTSSI